jgi:hypothetical protein
MFISNMTAYISSTSICRYISTFSTCALKLSIGNKKNIIAYKAVSVRLYTLYYFVYMYTQICHENGFPRRIFRPSPTWNFDDVNNLYSYSYVKGAKRNSHCVADSKDHKNYRICHIRKEIIHGSRRFVYI